MSGQLDIHPDCREKPFGHGCRAILDRMCVVHQQCNVRIIVEL